MMTSAFEQGAVPPIEMRHRLRIAREWAGLDQGGLADRMGVSRSTVSNAERTRVSPQRSTINLWAMACGVQAQWLRTGEAPPGPDDPSFGLGITSPDSPRVIPLTSAISARQRRSPRKKAHAA